MFKLSKRSKGKLCILVTGIVLIALVVGCSQPASPTPTPTQAAKAAPANEAKPEAKPAPKEAKAAATATKPAAEAVKAPIKLQVPYASTAAMFAAPWLTKEKGLFEKYGLDVEVPFVASSTTITAALMSGDVRLALMGGSALVNVNLSGADLVLIAGMVDVLGLFVYARPEIKRVEDLKGKKLGISRFGATTDFAARLALKKYGLEPDKDVAIVQTGGTPETLGAIQTGGVHAGIFGPPNTLVAKKAGMIELISLADMGVAYPMASAVVSKQYMSSNLDTVRSFMKAIVEGIAAGKKDKDFAIKVISKYSGTEDKEALEEGYDFYVTKLIPKAPYPSVEAIGTVLDEAASSNPKAKDVKPETYIDNSVVKELDESGFIKKLYEY